MTSTKRTWSLALSVLAGSLFAAGSASAASFTYNSFTVTDEQSIHILTPNNVTGGMGQIVLHGSGANTGQTVMAWCLDVYDFLTHSGTYAMGPLTTVGSGGSNPALTTTQINEIGSLMLHGNSLINTNTNVSAATQLAIWTIEYGASFTFSGVSTAVKNLALQYEGNVGSGGIWECPTCGVTLFSLHGDQNLGTGFDLPGGNQGSTPLPAALPLFAGGLGGFGVLAWRKKRKTAAAA